MPTVDEIRDWAGRNAVGSDDSKIGKIDHLYVDRQTGEPTFAAIKTGLFGGNDTLVPVEGAKLHDDHVHVAWDKDKVKDAPNVDADGELSEAEEAKLYEYYGIAGYSQYEGEDHATVTDYDRQREGLRDEDRGERDEGVRGEGTVANDISGEETGDAMTRSEEELRVGTTERETGKARLRKYVVTENVTQTVPVSREEVRVEREPITDENRGAAHDGADLSEEEAEVTLRAEEPVVEKNVVAKERVSLQKDTVRDEVEVDESVRKEQIETDDDVDESTTP